jgi:dihydrofolate reductase
MTATYTFDVLCTLDGFGSYGEAGDWGGFWGKQGPEFLDRRLAQYSEEQRMVLGASTFWQFTGMLGPIPDSELDPINRRMKHLPTTVLSMTLEEPLDWPDVTLARGDAVEVVARLKEQSPVPLRSHGSLSVNRALMAAGLVDRVQVTIFPVISGQTGTEPVFAGAADFDLELLESQTLGGRIQELVYRPNVHSGQQRPSSAAPVRAP